MTEKEALLIDLDAEKGTSMVLGNNNFAIEPKKLHARVTYIDQKTHEKKILDWGIVRIEVFLQKSCQQKTKESI